MDKEYVVHIYIMEYYSAMTKKEILPLATTWVNLESIMLGEINLRKTNTDDFTYMWTLKKPDR